MKSLYLIRHAKSSWADLEMKDFDRPLNDRGKKNAPFMGKWLAQENIHPDLIISSPAKRAITTARKIAKEIDYLKDKIIQDKNIYEASVKTLLQIVNQIENEQNIVFLFGHNPGFTDFANYLTGENISNIPTCGIVQINFEIDDWKEVSKDLGTLIRFEYPKKFI